MLGIEFRGAARAYPVDVVLKSKLIQDRIGGTRSSSWSDLIKSQSGHSKPKSNRAKAPGVRPYQRVIMDSVHRQPLELPRLCNRGSHNRPVPTSNPSPQRLLVRLAHLSSQTSLFGGK